MNTIKVSIENLENPENLGEFLRESYERNKSVEGFLELEESLKRYDLEFIKGIQEIADSHYEAKFIRAIDSIIPKRFPEHVALMNVRILTGMSGDFIGLYRSAAEVLSADLSELPLYLKPCILMYYTDKVSQPFLECGMIEDIARYRLEKGI
jgi:hypothetical protein